jgi:hypothetical protein
MVDLEERVTNDSPPMLPRPRRFPARTSDDELPKPSRRTPRVSAGPIGAVYGAVVICLLTAILLNTHELVLTVERRPDGPIRTLLLGPTRRLDTFASRVGLDRPVALLNAAQIDRDAAPRFNVTPGAVAAAPSTVPAPTATVEAPPTATVAPEGAEPPPATAVVPVVSAPPAPTPTTAPTRRTITAVAPLRVYVAGDSFVDSMAEVLAETGTKNGLMTVLPDGHPNSGLSDPSYIDWPVRLQQAMANDPAPEAVVFMAGANDGVPIRTSAGTLEYGTAAWNTEYARRAAQIMDIVGPTGARLYYVGQPIMRESKQNRIANDINIAISKEAATRPWVTYVDSWSLLTDANGNYADYLPGKDGKMIKARADDGIHLTPATTVWVADAVYAVIRKEWRLP